MIVKWSKWIDWGFVVMCLLTMLIFACGGCSGVRITEQYDKSGPTAKSKAEGRTQIERKFLNRRTGQVFIVIIPAEDEK